MLGACTRRRMLGRAPVPRGIPDVLLPRPEIEAGTARMNPMADFLPRARGRPRVRL